MSQNRWPLPGIDAAPLSDSCGGETVTGPLQLVFMVGEPAFIESVEQVREHISYDSESTSASDFDHRRSRRYSTEEQHPDRDGKGKRDGGDDRCGGEGNFEASARLFVGQAQLRTHCQDDATPVLRAEWVATIR